MSALLDVRGIRVDYGGPPVARDVSFHVNQGHIACLLGPSGCGKTTVLRAVAGFNAVSAGEIVLGGETLSRPGYTRVPERRGLSMVFQDHALFPHLSVAQNVAFGIQRQPRAERRRTVGELLELVGLPGAGNRYPHELSGGQQQRVALARALAPRPRLVLLDEPFSNLDVELRERLGREVRELLLALGTSAVLVTHHQDEAFALADRVGVMRDGAIAQWDSAYNLYHEPADRYVADFIGKGVFVTGHMMSGRDCVDTELGRLHGNRVYPYDAGQAVDILLRPDDVQPDADGPLQAVVQARSFKGAETLYTLRLDTGTILLSLFPSHLDHNPGERVRLRVDTEHLIVFARDEQAPDAHSCQQ